VLGGGEGGYGYGVVNMKLVMGGTKFMDESTK
jgi:hypothetical protein